MLLDGDTYAQPERLVPVVAAVLEVRAVPELLLRRQLEHFPADGELPVHLLLGQPEVDDVEEADLLDGFE